MVDAVNDLLMNTEYIYSHLVADGMEVYEEGVRLSPLARPSALEPFRGILIRYPADAGMRQHVLDALRVYSREADPRGEANAKG